MPYSAPNIYYWNSTISPSGDWTRINSTSMTTGPNLYVRTSGTGLMNSTGANRVRQAYVRTNTGWVKSYQAYLPNPPSWPTSTAPTSFANDTTYISGTTTAKWSAYINQTALKWAAVAVPTGTAIKPNGSYDMDYILEVLDTKTATAPSATYTFPHVTGATTIYTGLFNIPINTTKFYRVYAIARNPGGSTSSDRSSIISVTAGTIQPWSASATGLRSAMPYEFSKGKGSSDDGYYAAKSSTLSGGTLTVSNITTMTSGYLYGWTDSSRTGTRVVSVSLYKPDTSSVSTSFSASVTGNVYYTITYSNWDAVAGGSVSATLTGTETTINTVNLTP